MSDGYRAGFLALLGKPNAGKSTLLNALVGARLAAVSGLPQTTRERFLGIYSDEQRQLIFVDLPGMTAGSDKLNEALRETVLDSIAGVDAVLYLVEAGDRQPLNEDMEAALAMVNRPIVAAITKCDGRHKNANPEEWARESLPAPVRQRLRAVLTISAREQRGLEELLTAVTPLMPEAPPLYDPEDLTDRDMRFLSQELIREKLFQHLHEELPYACAVQIDEFKERESGKWFVAATIHVERESQKGMVIGKGGGMLKKISTGARQDIEALAGMPVFLSLYVKVRPKWRKKERDLREFGYQLPGGKKHRR